MILLDTDVCVELLRGDKRVVERRKQTESPVAVSFMTVGELLYGAQKSNNSKKNIAVVEEFLLSVRIIDSSYEIMRKFGSLKANLTSAGLPPTDADILIAATSLACCDMLITGNLAHFRRFEGLTLDNWICSNA